MCSAIIGKNSIFGFQPLREQNTVKQSEFRLLNQTTAGPLENLKWSVLRTALNKLSFVRLYNIDLNTKVQTGSASGLVIKANRKPLTQVNSTQSKKAIIQGRFQIFIRLIRVLCIGVK